MCWHPAVFPARCDWNRIRQRVLVRLAGSEKAVAVRLPDRLAAGVRRFGADRLATCELGIKVARGGRKLRGFSWRIFPNIQRDRAGKEHGGKHDISDGTAKDAHLRTH